MVESAGGCGVVVSGEGVLWCSTVSVLGTSVGANVGAALKLPNLDGEGIVSCVRGVGAFPPLPLPLYEPLDLLFNACGRTACGDVSGLNG